MAEILALSDGYPKLGRPIVLIRRNIGIEQLLPGYRPVSTRSLPPSTAGRCLNSPVPATIPAAHETATPLIGIRAQRVRTLTRGAEERSAGGEEVGDIVGHCQADLVVRMEVVGDVAAIGGADENDNRGSISGVYFYCDRAGEIAVRGCVPVAHMPEFKLASRADPESFEPGSTSGVHVKKLYSSCGNAGKK